MTLSEQITNHIRAGFPCLWISSIEHDDAEAEIRAAAAAQSTPWTVNAWDCDRGFTLGANPPVMMPDPVAAVHMHVEQAQTIRDGVTVLIARNVHHFLRSPDVCQALDTAISAGKQLGACIVILAPSAELPPELDRQIVTLTHEIPTRDELQTIAERIATEPGEMPTGHDLTALRDASAGLTRLEAEGAYSLSLAQRGRIDPADVWEFKAAAIGKSGLLQIHRSDERFSDIGGMDAMKTFCARALRPGRPAKAQPRGALLLGVPGTGKSFFAKALGNETGRPTLTLDIGSMFGSLVGQTEERIRRALAIVDAMAPAVLFVDEIDKALAGAGGNGSADSGVTQRLFGTLLTWLNDHKSDVFFICTANDISAIPPAFGRAERFDALFFLDFPTADERRAIWDLHTARHELDPTEPRPADENWTGSEIASCCRLSALLDMPLVEAAENVVPIHATAAESVASLRLWANGRCLASDRKGLYQSRQPMMTAGAVKAKESESRRKVQRPRQAEDN